MSLRSIFFPDPRPSTGFDFATAEQIWRRKNEAALTSTHALVVRGQGSWHPIKTGEIEAFLKQHLCDIGAPGLWTVGLAAEFKAWLAAGAETLPTGTFIKPN